MNNRQTLSIYGSENMCDSADGDVFIIEDELKQVSDQRREEILGSLTRIAHNDSSLMLESLLPYLVSSRHGSLPKNIILYQLLEEIIDKNSYKKIKLVNVDNSEQAVIHDLAMSMDLQLQAGSSAIKVFNPLSLLSRDVVLHLADQIFSWVLAKFLYRSSKRFDLLSFSTGESINNALVLNKLKNKTAVVSTATTISWYIKNKDHKFSEQTSIRPINTYTTLRIIFSQFSLLYSLYNQYRLNKWDIDSELENKIEKEFDIYMPTTIHFASSKAIENSIRQLLYYDLFKRAIQKENPKGVFVSTDKPRGRLALAASESKEVKRYYLPHSIICGSEIVPSQHDTIQFVEGEYAIRYLEDSPLCDELPELVATGRPIHEKTIKRSNQERYNNKSIDKFSILIATQPVDDKIRNKFSSDILNVIDSSINDYEVIIKPHPSEKPSFYKDLLCDNKYRGDVTIQDGNIDKFILCTDLTVTINSNVGLESIMLGSCTISYNAWVPTLSVFPYQKNSTIPVAEDYQELRDIFELLTRENYNKMRDSQVEFFESGFICHENSEKIATIIDSDLNNP